MGEIIFLTVCNKRNLSDILDEHTKELIREYYVLRSLLPPYEPETEIEFENLEILIKKYKGIKRELKSNRYREFILNTEFYEPEYLRKKLKPKKKEIKKAEYVPKKRKQRYTHKQPQIKQRVEISIDDLVVENYKLINFLCTFEEKDTQKALLCFERYKVIQKILSSRLEVYQTYNMKDDTIPRMIVLLGDKCSECGSKSRLQLHHLVKEEDGGKDDILNFQLLCRTCHNNKHRSVLRYREYKELVAKLEGI